MASRTTCCKIIPFTMLTKLIFLQRLIIIVFYELCDQYADYWSIYTNGSKVGERVLYTKASSKAYDCQI